MTEEKYTFDIKIKNSAGKLLRELMDYFKLDKAKDVVALALHLVNSVKGSEITVKKPDGSEKKIVISTITKENEEEKSK